MKRAAANTVSTGSVAAEEAVAQLVAQVLRRRASGELVSDEELIAEHPELMPQLATELVALAGIRRAYLASRRAGSALGPLRILDSDELEAPIDGLDVDAPTDEKRTAAIEGYTILDEIGAGGQATVFKAVQECTGRTVAIKVMLGGPLAGSRHRARFEREVAILAKIDHPNIVRVIDRGCTADGSFFFAMDYVDGAPLDDYLLARGGADEAAPLRLWITVARAVDEAHRHGIVHRDLKPSNILVDQRGEPHVMDFGLARPVAELGADPRRHAAHTLTGQMIGSLPWASPEQIGGNPDQVKVSSDIYSLGVVFYQVLTGEFPYPVTGTITQLVKNIASTLPEPPSWVMTRHRGMWRRVLGRLRPADTRRKSILDAILLKALAKRPADRYPSAAALAEDLENYLAGRPTVARSRFFRPTRHRRKILALLLIVAFGAAGAGSWAWRKNHRGVSYEVLALPTYTNSIGMRFVLLEPGTFLMGSPSDEKNRSNDERLHRVHLTQPIYFEITEVTQAQYRAIMGANPSDARFLGDDLPVQCVSWNDAVEFCHKLGSRESRSYRLPTEAEWEYACRAGSKGSFAGSGVLDEMGWYAGNGRGLLSPVARLKPNAWGLFDMHGGVAEWCSDSYVQTYPSDAAASLVDPTASKNGQRHILRGGDATQPEAACRAAARASEDGREHLPTVGFRVVLER